MRHRGWTSNCARASSSKAKLRPRRLSAAARLTLPPGLTVNPDAADGQTSCSDAQAGFGQDSAGACPDNSKIGTVEVRTPALDAPLDGSLYIGEPQPGNQYRLFMLFDGFGIHAKLAADVHPDPLTGQLTVTMAELPQVPFETFDLHLFASDRGLLATPTQCTLYRRDVDADAVERHARGTAVVAQRPDHGGPQRPRPARGSCGRSTRGWWRARRTRSPVTSAPSR